MRSLEASSAPLQLVDNGLNIFARRDSFELVELLSSFIGSIGWFGHAEEWSTSSVVSHPTSRDGAGFCFFLLAAFLRNSFFNTPGRFLVLGVPWDGEHSLVASSIVAIFMMMLL
jgi:hypothetical protein